MGDKSILKAGPKFIAIMICKIEADNAQSLNDRGVARNKKA